MSPPIPEPTSIADRMTALGITTQDLITFLELNAAIAQRVVYEDMRGRSRDRVLEALTKWERDGIPKKTDPRWKQQRDAAIGETHEQQRAAAKAKVDADKAYEVARVAAAQARNEEFRLKHLALAADREACGVELQGLRERKGLSIEEVAMIGGVRADLLDRIERGKPVGGISLRTATAIYALAVRVTSDGSLRQAVTS